MAESDVASSANHLLESARALGPLIRASAQQIEDDRQLTGPVVDALAEAGLFRMLVPKALGGGEVEPVTFVQIVEEIARADGSVGWCLLTTGFLGTLAALFPDETAREIYVDDPRANVTGVIHAGGRAVAVDGGYRVSGRWSFASGCTHATWFVGQCALTDGSGPIVDCKGNPQHVLLGVPRSDYQIVDTWRVTGLRGTGSHDVVVTDVFVPTRRTLAGPPVRRYQGPLYASDFPLEPVVASSLLLGLARRAIDTVRELAAVKTRGKRLLRDQDVTQFQIGYAEADLGAGRAYLLSTLREAWAVACRGEKLSTRQQWQVTLACTHAAELATKAIDLMWDAAGTSAISAQAPLDRCFRDAHTARQHRSISRDNYRWGAQVFLGLAPEVLPR